MKFQPYIFLFICLFKAPHHLLFSVLAITTKLESKLSSSICSHKDYGEYSEADISILT